MNKSVLISIRPRWIEKIARGEKTIEVRKTRPKLNPPFKCYIYCTRSTDHPAGWLGCYDHDLHKFGLISPLNIEAGKHMNIEVVSGMVVGDFTCDAILPITVFDIGSIQYWNAYSLKEACMTYDQMADYVGYGKRGFGWHISDLKIYDEPKELSELHHDCSQCGYVNARWDNCDFIIKHPPQSWCFVKCNVEGD